MLLDSVKLIACTINRCRCAAAAVFAPDKLAPQQFIMLAGNGDGDYNDQLTGHTRRADSCLPELHFTVSFLSGVTCTP